MATSQLTGSRSKTKRRHLDTDSVVSSDDESLLNVESWPRFLVVEGVDGEPLRINPFVVSKSIQGICGTVQNVTRLRSGSLLVECAKRQQSLNLLQAHHFANTEIVVSAHKTLNSCRGIVRDRAKCLSDMSEEEIVAEMKPQGVTSVKRFNRKDGEIFVKTNTYLFTFALSRIPSSIKAGYFNIGVDVYIPNPLRCFKCQQFGHGAKSCRNSAVCSRCSKKHDGTDCTDTIKCSNCSCDHMSSSKSCPSFVIQTKILKLKYTNDISFSDAKKLLQIESTSSTHSLTYSAAVSSAAVSSAIKVDNGCQTAISWVSNERTMLFQIDAEDTTTSPQSTSKPSQTEPLPENEPHSLTHSQLDTSPVPESDKRNDVTQTRKERKQQRKKESKALKHIKVPSPLTFPLEVQNPFEPLDMEVSPSLSLQRKGPSPRSRSPIEPP
ncbi:uncharacterized protein LOC125373265 [Haliotis rufescens]|uniref:uncharacterized protein LOC125373265 n=1 Tax=Haliotis rufescens TaxID=6454 RepID=UPI00201E8ED9|nr:uncharacterized protein LOC125373265 [Haliotis rufescens]